MWSPVIRIGDVLYHPFTRNKPRLCEIVRNVSSWVDVACSHNVTFPYHDSSLGNSTVLLSYLRIYTPVKKIKGSIQKVKKCQISKRGHQQGPGDETLKKARCQFYHVKFGHRVIKAVGLFHYKMHNHTQITFNCTKRWSLNVASCFFFILCCISDIFIHHI